MPLQVHPDDPTPKGFCPYHVSCLEGLASGPAIEKRWGVSAKELSPDHPAWELEAFYLAQVCAIALTTLSTQKIILGGGVMQRQSLIKQVREETLRLLNGYIQHPAILEHIDEYIVTPDLFPVSGLVGSYLIGKAALDAKG